MKTQARDVSRFTVSTLATVYGCCGYFDMCGDSDLMSLGMEGTQPFLDWIGWQSTDVCTIIRNFITYVRPERSGGARTAGYLADPCGDANSVEWGSCDFTLHDFARLRRKGPVRDATKGRLKLCENQPRYRLDGTPITSDAEYDMRLVLESMTQDLKRMLIDGSDATPGQFAGLEHMVATGYKGSNGVFCRMMDSIVINWNGKGMAGGAGTTWNGAGIGAAYDFIDVLLAVVRRIIDRIRMAPQLAAETMKVGDIIILAPSHILRCLLDAYTCWSVCPGAQYNEANLNTYEARTFRNNLGGGMFGSGKIYLDQQEIPLLAYDWGLIKSPHLSDLYVLTGSVGSVKTISGQWNDMSQATRDYPEAAYATTDGNRLLTWVDRDGTCVQRNVEYQPRLLMWAPWAQARFQNVKCDQPGGIISVDPWETSFFPETSFDLPVCP